MSDEIYKVIVLTITDFSSDFSRWKKVVFFFFLNLIKICFLLVIQRHLIQKGRCKKNEKYDFAVFRKNGQFSAQ